VSGVRRQPRGLSFLIPPVKLPEWIARQVFFAETRQTVVFAKVGQIRHARCVPNWTGLSPNVKRHLAKTGGWN
jgi:hypothetical protein